MAHQAGAYPGFCNMRRLGLFILSVYGTLVQPSYTPVWRGTERVKWFAPRTQHTVPEKGLNPDRLLRS